jgi:two-component sensor histidine kinase
VGSFIFYPTISDAFLSRERGISPGGYDTTGIEKDMISIRNTFLQDYYAKVGDFKHAYQYLLKNTALAKSIETERVRGRIAELDLRYKQDTTILRRDKLFQEQSNKIEHLRLTKYIWLMVSLFVIFIAAFVYIYMRKQRYLLQTRHINHVVKLRMQNIRNRVSPHFIFNVLNTEVASLKDKESGARLHELAKLLRNSLELSESINTTLDRELDFVKTYIDLEQRDLGDSFILQWKMDDHLIYKNVLVPAMIVQIPVENAIKHALRGKEGKKTLLVSVTKNAGSIHIVIQDNGAGYKPGQSVHKGTGTGLKVIYQTIALLNEKNTSQIDFRISNIENQVTTGTRVDISIPENYSYDL